MLGIKRLGGLSRGLWFDQDLGGSETRSQDLLLLLQTLKVLALGASELSGRSHGRVDGAEKLLQVSWLQLREKCGEGFGGLADSVSAGSFLEIRVCFPSAVGRRLAIGAVDLGDELFDEWM
jgi:hypothetical protein